MQVKAATEALQNGKLQEAGALLKSLDANQYLSAADRQQMIELSRQFQVQTASAAQAPDKADAKSLLAAGRAALQKGEFDRAEALANQAEKASSAFNALFQPRGSDTPARLKRDIQTARAQVAQAAQPQPKVEPEGRGDSPWFLKAFWGKNDKQDTADKESDRRVDAKMARQMVNDGFIFLKANDLEKAKLLATKAKELNVTWGPEERTPDMLIHEIQRALGGVTAPMPEPTIAQTKLPEAKPVEAPVSGDPRVLLRQGRTLLHEKKYEDADKLCSQLLLMNGANWGLWEDTPEKLRKDIQRQRQVFEREESAKVIADARKLFTQGNLDEAEKKAYLAQKMHGPYGVFDFGDRPAKLIEEIQRARQAKGPVDPNFKKDPENLVKLVDYAKDPPSKFGTPPDVSAGMQNASKNRAIVMVREAKEYERQGLLIEARQKALEARALKAPFSPEEESPESVLLRLSAKTDQQIQGLLQQAVQQAANVADPQRFEKARAPLGAAQALAQAYELDMSRVNQTALYLQQVAVGARPVDPIVANQPPVLDPMRAGATDLDIPTGDPEKDRLRKIGREKLRDAQNELSAGHYAQARKMAEDLYDARYGIQEDVQRLLRSISNEEYNQRIMSNVRTFNAGLDAFVQKDFRKARFIFQSLDPAMLPEQYQVRLREFMATREMQQENIVRAGYQEKVAGSPITANEPGGKSPEQIEQDNLLDVQKARDAVQFQALRQRGLAALGTAKELFSSKQREQRDQAIGTLESYLNEVKLAQFDQENVNKLRRPIETRIQQYKTLLAEERLAKAGDDMHYPIKWDEGKHQLDIKKRQDEIFIMMKEVNELMKQNKLAEAEAKAKQVRDLDPENPAALAAEWIASFKRKQKEWDNDEHDNWKWIESALPHRLGTPLDLDNPIEFNKRMRERAKGSGAIPLQSLDPKEQKIEYRLIQPLSLHFKNVPLQDAIHDIALQSGVQVVPDLGALQAARINLDALLSISVEEIAMKSALNILLSPLKLTYVIEDQVLKITTQDRTQGRIVRVVYPVADLVVVPEDHPLPDVNDITKSLERVTMAPANLPGYPAPSPYTYSPGDQISSPSSGLGSAFGSVLPGQSGHGPMPSNSMNPPKNKKEEMGLVLVDLIKNVIKKETWSDVGGQGDIVYTPFGLALVVNQVLDVQNDIVQLLESLRRLQDLQVAVELRAVLVSESFFERIGVDFNMNFITPTTTGKQALFNGNLATASANKTVTGLTQAGTLTPDLNIPVLNNTFNYTAPQFGGYQPGAGLSLGLAFLSDIQVFMFLEAVQGDQRAHVMQAPKITAYNGQQAFIFAQVNRTQVVGNVAPILAPNGQVVMLPQMGQNPLGLTLFVITPVVSPDRRLTRLNLTPTLTAGFFDPTGQPIIAVPQNLAATFTNGNPQPLLPTTPLTITINPLNVNVK